MAYFIGALHGMALSRRAAKKAIAQTIFDHLQERERVTRRHGVQMFVNGVLIGARKGPTPLPTPAQIDDLERETGFNMDAIRKVLHPEKSDDSGVVPRQ